MPKRHRRERLVVLTFGGRDRHDAGLMERTDARLELISALRNADIEIGAADDGRVPLARIERPLENADGAHHLGNDEVRVGVALSLDMNGDIQRDGAEAHLDPDSVLAGVKRFADERALRLKAQRAALDSLE